MAKVALVTGGAKRIGAEVVRSLAKEGFSIALHYRNSKQEALDLVAFRINGCELNLSAY